jgi:hypothetical protein
LVIYLGEGKLGNDRRRSGEGESKNEEFLPPNSNGVAYPCAMWLSLVCGFLPASFNRATMAFLLERNHGNLLLGISGDFYENPGFFRQKRSEVGRGCEKNWEKSRVFIEIPRNPQQ